MVPDKFAVAAKNESTYLNVLTELVRLAEADEFDDNRTDTQTVSIIGPQLRFDLRGGLIPLLSTKRVPFKTVLREVLWYFQGTGNIQYLRDHKIKIWDEWANDNGDLGPVYGVQWRNFNLEGIDQVASVIDQLRNDPTSRRMIVTAWNPAVLPDPKIPPKDNVTDGDFGKQALPPCHYGFQLVTKKLSTNERLSMTNGEVGITTDPTQIDNYLDEMGVPKRMLSLILNQRSCDFFLGGAFNIVSYSIILRMFAHVANMAPGELIWNIGDCHLYSNHVDAAKRQLKNSILESAPIMTIVDTTKDIDQLTEDDFILEGYVCADTIKAPVAI